MDAAAKKTGEENRIKPENAAQIAKMRKIGLVGGIVLLAFLLGFVPMWLSARGYANERDAAQAQLRPSVLQNDLAMAAIYARRGEYEQARQQASDFYTALRAEFDRSSSALTVPAQREVAQQILAQRDEIITLLARNDPAAAERLTDLYIIYRQAVNPAPLPPEQQQK